MKKDALYRKGMKTRREVLGAGREAAIVREEDDFSMPLRIFTTRYVWGEFWSGKGSSRKTRGLRRRAGDARCRPRGAGGFRGRRQACQAVVPCGLRLQSGCILP